MNVVTIKCGNNHKALGVEPVETENTYLICSVCGEKMTK